MRKFSVFITLSLSLLLFVMINCSKLVAAPISVATDNEHVELIELLADPSAADQIGTSLRLIVEKGKILDFQVDPKYKTTAIPTCSEMRFFTTTNLCVDILNQPANTPFVRGDHLGTLKIKWDADSSRNILRTQGNGYSNGKVFSDVNDITLPVKTSTANTTTAKQFNYLPSVFFFSSVILFGVATYLILKKDIFSKFPILQKHAYEGATFVFAGLLLVSGIVVQTTSLTSDSAKLDLSQLPMTGSSDSAYPLNRKVKIVVFDPTMSNGQDLISVQNWNSPESLTREYVDFFKSVTSGRLNYTVVETQTIKDFTVLDKGQKYNAASYINCLGNFNGCFRNNDGGLPLIDYASLVNTQNYCQQFNNGDFDELWLFGGPYFGFLEAVQTGQNAFFTNGGPITGTGCNKPMSIMGFSYERDLGSMVEDFIHRTEGTMRQVYNGNSGNWESFQMNGTQENLNYSGCGHAHYTPNSIRDYDWSNNRTVSTYCDEFLNYPNTINTANLRDINCTEWNCNQIGYFNWLLRRLPNKDGIGPDGKQNDWWKYIVIPESVVGSLPAAPVQPLNVSDTAQVCPADGSLWCSNHGGIFQTVDHDVANWSECLAWCQTSMSSEAPICQYNADGPRNCWTNKTPAAGINSCKWEHGVPPYGYCLSGQTSTTPTPTPINTPKPVTGEYSIGVKNTAQMIEGVLLENSKEAGQTGVCGPMDYNNDQNLSMDDIWRFAEHYHQHCSDNNTSYGQCGGRDYNGDGVVDINDLYRFLSGYEQKSCNF